MRQAVAFGELSRDDFRAAVGDLVDIYAAAMDADASELPSRHLNMERHSANPDFRALAVTAGPRIVAFTYGFRGLPGQWWHDVVRSGLAARLGHGATRDWLRYSMEVAEVHVHPDYQARGIGRAMVTALTSGRPEATALLSTRDAPTPARALYRSLGFTDLLTGFVFPGGGPAYAIMGAPLPLARPVPA